MENRLKALQAMAEEGLRSYFTGDGEQKRLYDAMRYSLLAGGKRIRPVLTLEFCRVCGGDMVKALPMACGIEMLHTYSLIHDDLPCMDNDELRRGKPTNHVVYGECTAVLAGDALQASAFDTLLSADLPAEAVLKAAKELTFAAGTEGICGGQILDMEGEGKALSIEQVNNIHRLKTAAMIKAACRIGVIAGGGNNTQLEAAEKYADSIGLTFQIRDDILDITSTTETMGKTVGKDASSGKNTYAALLGIPECERIIAEETEKAKAAIMDAFEEPDFLCWLADKLAGRKY
jgi:geranylgeranyl diphosphate synthase type II